MDISVKEKLMRMAMDEASIAIKEGNSPFGAILTDLEGNVIEMAHNTQKTDSDPTAHAEINLIRKVTKKHRSTDLSTNILISNAQSCSMCFSAAIKAKIENFIFGAESESHMNPNLNVFEIAKFTHNELIIDSGILQLECKNQIANARHYKQNLSWDL